jgi:casein kinase II subunit beta
MKTRLRSLMSRLSRRQQNCCMGSCTNVTCLRELDSTRWSVKSFPPAHYHHHDYGSISFQAEKYEAGVFGSCPRVYCMGCNVVPCGRSDLPGLETVKLFCPNCNDIYVPASSRFQGVDGASHFASDPVPCSLIGVGSLPGAFFGTTFAHLFFQTYRELMPAPFWKQPSSSGSMSPSRSPRSVTGSNSSQQAPFVNPNPYGGQKRAAGKIYVPRIYGFKVSERAKSGPRMQWMRLRPESPEELDEVDWRGRWIDDEEDQYDDGIDGATEEDRRMEDFDPVRRFFFSR